MRKALISISGIVALVYLLRRPVAQVDDSAVDTPEVAPEVDDAEQAALFELGCEAWSWLTESERLRVGAWLMKWKESVAR